MSHHSDDVTNSPLDNVIRQFVKAEIGPTGEFPEGKLTKSDEGGIQFAIGVRDGKVCMDFGKPIAWIGMNPGDALKLAESLIQHSRKAAKGTGSILTLNI